MHIEHLTYTFSPPKHTKMMTSTSQLPIQKPSNQNNTAMQGPFQLPETMKAVITTGYGGPEVYQVQEIDVPTPKDNEVLIKISASSVTAAHTAMRTGKPYVGRLFLGLRKPKTATPGTDLAGVVVQTGKWVSRFRKGDKVVVVTDIKAGAQAEFIAVQEDDLIVRQPDNVTAAEANGILDGGTTALAFFTDQVQIQPGQKVMINGASGSIGTAAIQLAKHFGAEVTAVCSGRNAELVRSLGADHVVDYTQTDVYTHGSQYDIIFDTVGKLSFRKSKVLLIERGVFLTPVLTMGVLGQMLLSGMFGKKKLKFAATGLRKKGLRMRDLKRVQEFLADGTLKTVIDRTYSLDQIREAHQFVDQGRKRGNVILSISE